MISSGGSGIEGEGQEEKSKEEEEEKWDALSVVSGLAQGLFFVKKEPITLIVKGNWFRSLKSLLFSRKSLERR